MAYRLPPLVALRAFEAAARHLSFKKAAEELHVTPGAVSQQIKALEDYLGRPVFLRLSREVRLTPEGESMLPKLREGFECLAAAVAATRRQPTVATVSVVAPPSFATRWLMPRLGRFTERFPEIPLRVAGSMDHIDRGDVLPIPQVDPLSDVIEIAVRYGHGHYPGCRANQIFAPVLVAACSPALLYGEHPLETPADLRWHVLINDDTVPESGELPTWNDWLRQAGVEGIETARGPSFGIDLALEAAIDGLGVVLALKPLIAESVAAGRLVIPFDVTVPSRHAYYLVVAESLAERPEVEAFSAWLLGEASADRLA